MQDQENDPQSHQHFEEWVAWKDRFDRGLALFGELDSSRGETEKEWMEVAVALAAIDRSLGIDMEDALSGKGGGKGRAGPQSMFDAFKKWTMESHTFVDVKLSESELTSVSEAVLELMEEEGVMPALQYTYPPEPPRRGLKSRPLSVDQKATNAIFLRRLRAGWKEANKEMRRQMAHAIEDAETIFRLKKNPHSKSATRRSSEAKEQDGEDEEKKEDEEDEPPLAKLNAYERDQGFRDRKEKYTYNALDAMGVRRLAAWLEEDEDRLKERDRLREMDRVEEARRAHESWAKRKDELRIKLPQRPATAIPQPGGEWQPPRFDFSSGKGLVRPNKVKFASTTIDLMRSSGAKYAYAMGQGRQGMEGDLEKCKRQAARWRADHKAKQRRRDEEREEGRRKAFEEWSQQKSLTDRTLTELKFVDPPTGASDVSQWLEVGQALKRVDGRLLRDFVHWTGSAFSAAHCQMVWDALPPVACDTHSLAYSALRETFLKLLKPGINYREAFERMTRRKRKSEEGAEMALTKRELRTLLTKELGIVMKEDELRRLIDAFDTNQDQVVSWREFEDFTGGDRDPTRGDAAARLRERCAWQTTCRETGMPNAYTTTVCTSSHSRDPADTGTSGPAPWGGSLEVTVLKNGETRKRLELPGRKRRVEVLRRYGLLSEYDDEYDEEYEGESQRQQGQKKCAAATWSIEERQAGLRVLLKLGRPNREAEELKKVIENGQPPAAPRLWPAALGHEDVGRDPSALTTEMLLCWGAAPDSRVAFFSLEMSGAEGSRAFRQGEFREICRDPPDADSSPEGQFWIRDLRPNTLYDFRMRAFNGFGPSPYSHRAFATRPTVPDAPVLVRSSPTELQLRWQFGSRYALRLKELRHVFDEVDRDGSGDVSRDELLEALASDHPGLLALLKSSKLGGGSNGNNSSTALTIFDAIEANDDENISWEEFLRYFSSTGMLDDSMTSSRGGGGGKAKAGTAGTKYVVEQCECEEVDKWKEVWRGTGGEASIKGLEPGQGYRFRVLCIGGTGLEGPRSPDVVANTLLEAPSAPRVASAITSSSVALKWEPCGFVGPAKDEKAVNRMLAEWAKAGTEDNGVNLAEVFSRYDTDRSGAMDALELGNLLEDLGVNPTEERLRVAFAEFDSNSDGIISFEEFEAWWGRSQVTYILKRDAGVHAWACEAALLAGTSSGGGGSANQDILQNILSRLPAAPLSIASYRGALEKCTIAGLSPNTLYRARLRASNARTQSSLSPAAVFMTAPLRPEPPAVVRSDSKEVVLKWYPGRGGSHKYVLERLFLESLEMGPESAGGAGKDKKGWEVMYEGGDNVVRATSLASNSVYRFRVASVNLAGGRSEWSEQTQVATLSRDEANAWRPSTAADQFTVDCNGNVVVGDSIIFTERLYVDSTGRLMAGLSSGPAGTMAGSTPRLDVSMLSIGSEISRMETFGEFVGERTVAGHVIKDSFTSMRRKHIATAGTADGALLYNKISAARRTLRIEVMWSTVSRKEADQFLIQKGAIVERAEKKLLQFEMFRAPWVDESRRKGVKAEWDILTKDV